MPVFNVAGHSGSRLFEGRILCISGLSCQAAKAKWLKWRSSKVVAAAKAKAQGRVQRPLRRPAEASAPYRLRRRVSSHLKVKLEDELPSHWGEV